MTAPYPLTVHCDHRIRLRPGVYRATGADGQVTVFDGRRWGQRLGALTAAEDAALRALAAGECGVPDLENLVGTGEGTLLPRLLAGGWLVVHHDLGTRRLVTVRPVGPCRQPPGPPPAAPVLSRFAILHPAGDGLVLESPLGRAAVDVHDPAVLSVILRLAREPGTLDATAVDLPAAVVAELLDVLHGYGFVHEARVAQAHEQWSPQEQWSPHEQWSPQELWFHARSRTGHQDPSPAAAGAPVRRGDPPPARRQPWPGTAIPLPEPSPGRLGQPLADVLASRRSVRTPAADSPLTLVDLGDFLHHSARARAAGPGGDPDVSRRPSPSGGARHSLEIYLVVTAVAGLAAGMYHYDPFDHVLEPVPATPVVRRCLVEDATRAAAGSPPPHVLLVFSARFGRTTLKYQGFGYALILEDLGALMQTMYLVATAMGLAPCALGTGDVDLFARATGLDRLVEASVGEFMLSAPPGHAGASGSEP